MKAIFIDEILKDCVVKTSDKILAQLRTINTDIQDLYFQHGHPYEIIATLKQKSKTEANKPIRYPLIALFRDFPEKRGTRPGIYSEATLNIIIATRTNPGYYADQRKEKNFKPILYPILFEFLEQIKLSGKFQVVNEFSFEQIDHYFWGRESIYGAEANIFTDTIDCIEIKNLNLQTYLKNC